jgi:hypothetical protein
VLPTVLDCAHLVSASPWTAAQLDIVCDHGPPSHRVRCRRCSNNNNNSNSSSSDDSLAKNSNKYYLHELLALPGQARLSVSQWRELLGVFFKKLFYQYVLLC